MGQRMAGSGSNSRKGFPETGGECCQPQGQEEMMYLEAHRVKPSPWAPPFNFGKLKMSPGAGASSARGTLLMAQGTLLMAWTRHEPSCFKNC